MGAAGQQAYADLCAEVRRSKFHFGRLLLELVEEFVIRLTHRHPGVYRNWLKASGTTNVEALAAWIVALDQTDPLEKKTTDDVHTNTSDDEEAGNDPQSEEGE